MAETLVSIRGSDQKWKTYQAQVACITGLVVFMTFLRIYMCRAFTNRSLRSGK
jgi:hypothetical protein